MDRIQTIASLFLCGFLCVFSGCESEATRDYQEFSSLSEEESDSASTVNEVAEDGVAARDTSEVTTDTIEPLVAVKPVYGQSAGELKTNIDNKTSTPAETREIKLLVEKPDFRQEKGAARVSYDDLDLLKVLNMEPVPTDAVSHFSRLDDGTGWREGDNSRIHVSPVSRDGDRILRAGPRQSDLLFWSKPQSLRFN